MKKSFWLLILCFSLLILPAKTACAKEVEFRELNNKINFNKYSPLYYSYVINVDEKWGEIKTLYSTNKKVAVIFNPTGWGFTVYPTGKGTCTVKIADKKGNKANIKVTVTEKYVKKMLSGRAYIYRCWYGTRKVVVYAEPGSKGIMKIGRKKYRVSIGSSGKKAFKLKKRYKLNQKIVLSLKKGGMKYAIKEKLRSETYSCAVTGSNNKLKVDTHNLHKGDVITVKHRGKTYSTKIKKDLDNKEKAFTFKTTQAVRKNGDVIVVVIKNKSNKKLDRTKYTLKDGWDSAFDKDK